MLFRRLHLIHQFPLLFIVADVLERRVGDVAHGFAGEEGLVGGDDDVGEREEAGEGVVVDDFVGLVLVEVVALFLVNVEAGGAYLLIFQALDKLVGVDELTAPGVDNHDAGLHFINRLAVDEIFCFGRERAVESDDVRVLVQLVEGDVAETLRGGIRGVGEDIVGEDFHPETLEDVNQYAGDFPGADDTHRLAVHVETHEAVEREVAVARPPAGTGNLTIEGKHQGDSVFRHGVGRISRDADDADAILPGGSQIDVVVAGAAESEEFRAVLGHGAEDFGVGGIIHEDAGGLGFLGGDDGVGVQVALVVFALEAESFVGLVEGSLVVGLRSEESDSHIIIMY